MAQRCLLTDRQARYKVPRAMYLTRKALILIVLLLGAYIFMQRCNRGPIGPVRVLPQR